MHGLGLTYKKRRRRPRHALSSSPYSQPMNPEGVAGRRSGGEEVTTWIILDYKEAYGLTIRP
jgi:hypothetical protein